jgi:hypothetical protein
MMLGTAADPASRPQKCETSRAAESPESICAVEARGTGRPHRHRPSRAASGESAASHLIRVIRVISQSVRSLDACSCVCFDAPQAPAQNLPPKEATQVRPFSVSEGAANWPWVGGRVRAGRGVAEGAPQTGRSSVRARATWRAGMEGSKGRSSAWYMTESLRSELSTAVNAPHARKTLGGRPILPFVTLVNTHDVVALLGLLGLPY